MGASLWDQVGLPLLIGLAIEIVATALCFLSARLWNYFIKQPRERLTPQTAVEESAYDQPLSDGDAAAHANAMPDLEMGNGYGPVEGGESMAEPELELGIVNGGQGIDYFSDQDTHTPVIEFTLTTPKTQVTRDAATGTLVGRVVEMNVSHSQQERRLLNEAPVDKGCRCLP